MLKSKTIKAFTLVEMLIVIVIIGVLAAAILPNLIGARNRANDVSRVAALNKINAGIQASIADTGRVPDGCGPLSSISGVLADAGMLDIPVDPNLRSVFDGIGSDNIEGQYGYCAITANGSPRGAYVLMAKVERAANANYVVYSGGSPNNTINGTIELESLQTCSSFREATDPDFVAADNKSLVDEGDVGNEVNCGYTEGMGELRYVVIQS